MTTTTLRPTADGTFKNWPAKIPLSPTTHFDAVCEVDPDEDDSYIGTIEELELRTDTYTHGGFTLPVGDTAIDKLILSLRARRDPNPTWPSAVRCNYTFYINGTEYNVVNSFSLNTYWTYSNEYTTNPDTSVAWTEDDVNALEFGAQGISNYRRISFIDYWSFARCTQVYLEVVSSGAAAAAPLSDGLFFVSLARRRSFLKRFPPLLTRRL